jgi:branched-chain amino acid transport system permease protein
MTITILNGLTYGGLLFIVSAGLTLVFGVMRVVNMSHGAIYLGSAYVALAGQQASGSWLVAVLAGCVTAVVASILLRLVVRLVDGDMPQTLLTLGLTLALSDLCLWIWGGLPQRIEPPKTLARPVTIFGITYPGYRLFMLVLAAVIGVALWLLMSKTQLGRLLRAGVDDREMVTALGKNINALFLWAFVISGALVGLGAAVGGSYLAFGPGTEFSILTLALVVVILGGMGSIPGSAVGAVLVGLVDAFGRTYTQGMSTFLLMGTLVIVLAIRPQGLFGGVQ